MPLSPVGQHLDGKLLNREQPQSEVLDIASLSSRLDNSLEVLKRMLKQPGGAAATGAASVQQFLEKFEKLQADPTQLEDALTSFGGQWDWLVSTDSNQGQVSLSVPPSTTSLPQIITTTHQPITSDITSPKVRSHKLSVDSKANVSCWQKAKKKKLDDKDLSISSPVFSTNIVNGEKDEIFLRQTNNNNNH